MTKSGNVWRDSRRSSVRSATTQERPTRILLFARQRSDLLSMGDVLHDVRSLYRRVRDNLRVSALPFRAKSEVVASGVKSVTVAYDV